MQKRVDVPYSAPEVKAAFKVFEGASPPGYVKVSELVQALRLYGGGAGVEKLSDEKIAELVSQMEPDVSGLVNYSEFVTMMLDN